MCILGSGMGTGKLEDRLWKVLDEADLDLLITQGEDGFPHIRPMTLLAYEEDKGILWFATSRSSRKVAQIQRNPKVVAFFAVLEEGAFASFFGEGEVVDNPVLKSSFWEDRWYEFWKGPDDTDYVLLKIKAQKAQFHFYPEGELWELEF